MLASFYLSVYLLFQTKEDGECLENSFESFYICLYICDSKPKNNSNTKVQVQLLAVDFFFLKCHPLNQRQVRNSAIHHHVAFVLVSYQIVNFLCYLLFKSFSISGDPCVEPPWEPICCIDTPESSGIIVEKSSSI